MHQALHHVLSIKWIENGQIPASDYTAPKNTLETGGCQLNAQVSSTIKGVVMSSYLQGDINGVANAARLTVTCACGEIACQEAKGISFPYIFWLAWANLT